LDDGNRREEGGNSEDVEEGSGEIVDVHRNHMLNTLTSLNYIKNIFKPPPRSEIDLRAVQLPRTLHSKTLIFDLDETLIHCVENIQTQSYDMLISVEFENGELIEAGINIRPFAYECLKKVREHY
jgi:CTD small phosphatase-like protein 2